MIFYSSSASSASSSSFSTIGITKIDLCPKSWIMVFTLTLSIALLLVPLDTDSRAAPARHYHQILLPGKAGMISPNMLIRSAPMLRRTGGEEAEWQRKMDLLLGRASIGQQSAEQQSELEKAIERQRSALMADRKPLRPRSPNDSFRAAIKQILMGIHESSPRLM